ncbi:MAG: DHHA1 domain-containing protein [Thermoleophilaceae bacterium]
MVPLRGENRRIARQGIEALARTRRPGLRALMRVAGLEPGEVDAQAAGFRLGPRINAAGRLARADAALELLLTEDPERADQVARELDLLNRDRRETEQRMLSAADAACADQLHAAAIVVAAEGWHPGVVGIVASRLVERHRRPCVVIALDGATGRGSGRSIAPYDLHAGIASAQRHLLGFGGHRMAAGLQIETDRVAELRAALAAHAGERLGPADLIGVQKVDAVLGGGGLTLDLAEELERLGPFGAGNPAPALLVPGARIEHVTAMGEEHAHARFSLVAGAARARGVAFRTSQRSLAACGAQAHDVAVSLERNCWNGRVEPRVVMCSLSPTRPGALVDLGARPFWEELRSALACDPALWWPAPSEAPTQSRTVSDRRGEGFAGLAGDLLTSGEPVLVVVADVERRRSSLETLVAGMAPRGLGAISWTALGAKPGVAAAYPHLLALDPPPTEEGVALFAGALGHGSAHLAWGDPECSFTAAYWRAQLALRPALAELWRALDGGSLAGDALASALRGSGAYPRSGALGARLLRVLSELALVDFDVATRSCKALPGARTDLERSAAHRAYGARLAAADRFLAGAAGAHTPITEARAGGAGAIAGDPGRPGPGLHSGDGQTAENGR